MILLENNFARESFDKAQELLSDAVKNAGGEVDNIVKWDERKLAYEIKKQKRATYVLMHFKCDPLNISKIEEEYSLVKGVLRYMIVNDEDGTNIPEPTEPVSIISSY